MAAVVRLKQLGQEEDAVGAGWSEDRGFFGLATHDARGFEFLYNWIRVVKVMSEVE